MLTRLIRLRLGAGRRVAWWAGRGVVGKGLLPVTILKTSCLGCLNPLHSASMTVPLVVRFCLALGELQGIVFLAKHIHPWLVTCFIFLLCSLIMFRSLLKVCRACTMVQYGKMVAGSDGLMRLSGKISLSNIHPLSSFIYDYWVGGRDCLKCAVWQQETDDAQQATEKEWSKSSLFWSISLSVV